MVRAYLDRLSVPPGGVVQVHGSDIQQAQATVREHLHSDPHPDGPGIVVEDCSWGSATVTAPVVPPDLGSYAVSDGAFSGTSDFTLSMWIWLTDLREDEVLASWRTVSETWSLRVVGSQLTLVGDGAAHVVGQRIRERTWTFVGVAHGAARALHGAGTTVFASVWGRTGGPFMSGSIEADLRPGEPRLWLGALPGGQGQLDGRIAGVRIHRYALDVVELMNVMNGVGAAADAEWDLADRSEPDCAPSLRGAAGELVLFHAPMRSNDGPPPLESSGRAVCGEGSLHFHRDDTEDCGWPVVLRLDVPSTTPAGIYSLRLASGPETFELPFVVSRADEVTLLVPTLTWQAYANLGRDHTWPGLSHYSLHSDGSPVTMTTSRRPTQTFAPSARLEVDAGDGFATGANAAHLMMADLYAWYWLRHEFPDRCGVVDDRDLHAQGPDLLASTKVLVLSAHPEYWTSSMLDALDEYLGRGGSVVYLGGNGLYWVTSLHPIKPHLMEIRRWGGSQTWSIEEADRLHQFEPCAGGLWEDAGRPPNATVGIAFGGFGNGPSMSFVRTPESYDDRWSWIFEGLEGEVFGEGGLNAGAGNEFDVFDPRRTPPGESVVIATSSPKTADHFGTFERRGARAPSPDVHCDVVLTRTPAGGLVLAIGSITASGCLTSRRDVGLARVVSNGVRRMLGTSSAGADG